MIRQVNAVAFIAPLLLVACASQSQTAASITPPQMSQAKLHPHGASKDTSACPCIYVTNGGAPSITVYGSGAMGNVAPLQYIHGNKTTMIDPWGIAVDSARNIYVAEPGSGYNNRGSVTIFAAGSTGNVAPVQTITGPNTGLFSPFWVAINPVNQDIYVSTEGPCPIDSGSCVLIFAPGANGNTAPIGEIYGPYADISSPVGLALDGNGTLYVGNQPSATYPNGYVTVYSAGSEGNVPPIQTIAGSNTGIKDPAGIAIDSTSNIYVDNYSPSHGPNGSVVVFASGATGNVSPIRTIAGRKTKLISGGIAVDSGGNLFVPGAEAGIFGNVSDWVAAYAPGANGNVKPLYKIGGGRTKLSGPTAVAIK